MSEPSFSLGIEEEYLLVDVETCDLAAAPETLMTECAEKAGGQVSPEFLQCQIEVGTAVCKSIGEARGELVRLRTMVRDTAAKYGLAPIAVSTIRLPSGTSSISPTSSATASWRKISPGWPAGC